MEKRKSRRRRKRTGRFLWVIVSIMAAITFGMAVYMLISDRQGSILTKPESNLTKPDELLLTYMDYISEQNYKEMYQMIDVEASGQISEEDFIKRNSAIYEGIEMQNMTTTIISYNKEENVVKYRTAFDTVAGNISFENEAYFLKREDGCKLVWTDSLIYPGLSSRDRVRVSATQAKRGEILDRNGRVLAGPGVASSVGIVPGKMENRENAIEQMAELLGMEPEEIEKKLSAKWVKDDSFVPVKTLRKVEEIELMSIEPDEEVIKEHERQQQLLEIPGVMISDTGVRAYPLGDAAAHLVGYVQSVTAEDLEKHAGEGYTAGSVIGRSGAEGLFESELKGRNGCRIYIVDAGGNEKEELACQMVENGKNIKLTIDSELQRKLYEQFKEDKSCSVAMNPYTGEVLALVSTPSYDNNDFILGLSDEKWTALNEDENKPLYNRFRQVWCPGSTFKPITAAIGLESGAVDPNEDYGNVGLSWQKDASWGSYHVTTLHAYDPVVLENALIYSDNIYFAKAALKIGADEMKDSLLRLGFQEEMPFEIVMSKSRYSNTENIETEIQLADSGYGQGQILVNPLHMACIYTAFCNKGNVIKPYLIYRPDAEPEYWIKNAFSENTTNIVLGGIKKVINDSRGTGYRAHREDVLLAGKTGTAEIKASKEDTSGTELGWFAVFTAESTEEHPILIVSMVEDVKGRGGSGYVVGKDKEVLESWFSVEIVKDTVMPFGSKEEKGYDLPVSDSEQKEAEDDCKEMMGLISELYKNADKGCASNVVIADEIMYQMVEKLKSRGCPVTITAKYSNMENYKELEDFLNASISGSSGSAVVYKIHSDGGIWRRKYSYDGKDMYVLSAKATWSDDNKPVIAYISYTRIKEWKLTDKGWFCYELCVPEYPEVTEAVDGSCMVRVKPITEENREMSEKCVLGLSYQGNNLLCSDWDADHMESLDYNGIYEYLYEMKYQEKFPSEDYPDGIPKDEFEHLIMEYLPVTSKEIQDYAVFDEEKQTYAWARLGCFNYVPTYFGTSFPEVTNIRENDDGTTTLTVDAVCSMILFDDAVITHELTVRFAEDGSFQYLGNKILDDGISNIPEYQYRIIRE